MVNVVMEDGKTYKVPECVVEMMTKKGGRCLTLDLDAVRTKTATNGRGFCPEFLEALGDRIGSLDDDEIEDCIDSLREMQGQDRGDEKSRKEVGRTIAEILFPDMIGGVQDWPPRYEEDPEEVERRKGWPQDD